MKFNACEVFCHGDFADQFYGTLAGVNWVRIELHVATSERTRQSTVLLHTADSGAHAEARESMSAATKQPTIRVYQLKVSLRAVTPMIWRRLRVTSDTTIAQLHAVLQIAMGWEDLHLHQFRIHGKTYGIYRAGGISFADDPHQVTLADFKPRRTERFIYEYDMGDYWQHDVRLEQILPFDPHKHYPVCTAGTGDCPPEDCGGLWEYRKLIAERYSLLALLQMQDDQALIAPYLVCMLG